MKRLFLSVLALCLLLSGCSAGNIQTQKQYTATFLDLFDTVTTVVGKAESKESFEEKAQAVHDALLPYHRLFDIYTDYEGLNNLKTVNDNAGIAPVAVEKPIIDLLLDCKKFHASSGGLVNAAMGSVLKLWHEARSDGTDDPQNTKLPDESALKAAAQHTDFDTVIIDESASTVYISDPLVQLDVGAIAKGWAVQRLAETAPKGLLVSVGGNVCATGAKDDAGTPWVVGIQDPEGGDKYLHTLNITSGSVVTSGDYQRAYAVDGKLYHHIIDPNTLYPSQYWRSVSIVCPDSGLADMLSTALFLLPYEEGLALLKQFDAQAFWIDAAGKRYYSPGFEELIRT